MSNRATQDVQNRWAQVLAFDFQDSGTGERGCGRREPGGLYAVTDVGYGGTPWWQSLIDPPDPVTPRMMAELGIAPRDVSLRSFELEGVKQYYLLDWIGAGGSPTGEGYWNPLDVLQEGLSGKGFSGRVPVDKIDWSLVKQGETLRWLIHPHAIITNTAALWGTRLWDRYLGQCVTYQEDHNLQHSPPPFCDSLWWETIQGGLPINPGDPTDRRVIRTIGSLTYPAWRAPEDFAPEYLPGIFLKLPFHLEIIIDPDQQRHEAVARKLEQAGQAYRFQEN